MDNKPNLGEAFATLMGNMQQNQEQKTWWQSYSFPETIRFEVGDLINFARSALFSAALQGDSVVYEDYVYELIRLPNEVRSMAHTELKARLIYDRSWDRFYVTQNGALQISEQNAKVTICIVTSSSKELAIFRRFKSNVKMEA